MTLRTPLIRVGLAILAALLPASAAFASTVVAYDLQQLVGHSNEVVVAQVISKHYRRSDDSKRIMTEYVLLVREGVKGSCRRGEKVTMYQPGGSMGGIGMRVAGTPDLVLGEEYLLFARSAARSDGRGINLAPVGMSQGALRIGKNKLGKRMVAATAAVNAVTIDGQGRIQQGERAVSGPVSLEMLLRRVRSLVAAQRGTGF